MCECTHVCSPGCTEVRGSRCWMVHRCPWPDRPSTKQRQRERGRDRRHCTPPRLYKANWLPPSAAHCAAKHKPDRPVTTQGRGRRAGRKDTRRERRVNEKEARRQPSKRSNEAESPPCCSKETHIDQRR